MYKYSLVMKNVSIIELDHCKAGIRSNLASLGIASRQIARLNETDSLEAGDSLFSSIFTYFYLDKVLSKEDMNLILTGLEYYKDSLAVLLVDDDMYCILSGNDVEQLYSGEFTSHFFSLATLKSCYNLYADTLPKGVDKLFFSEQLNFADGKMLIP